MWGANAEGARGHDGGETGQCCKGEDDQVTNDEAMDKAAGLFAVVMAGFMLVCIGAIAVSPVILIGRWLYLYATGN